MPAASVAGLKNRFLAKEILAVGFGANFTVTGGFLYAATSSMKSNFEKGFSI
jgi:hypothetical protein